jgi:hypothetical protein
MVYAADSKSAARKGLRVQVSSPAPATVGDFDGGGKADLAITVEGATYFYSSTGTGTGTGTWKVPAGAVRSDPTL